MRAVTAAVIIEDGRLLLTRRAQGDHLAGLWELPGGKVEPGETPEACLARELREELEMECSVGEMLAKTTYEYAHGSFEVTALRVVRRSEFRLRVHSEAAWVGSNEVDNFSLAPADIALIGALRALPEWRPRG